MTHITDERDSQHISHRAMFIQSSVEKMQMATLFCQKCKQSHPGRVCDYDDKAECAETNEPDENSNESTDEISRDESKP